jgi:hypothetical protein
MPWFYFPVDYDGYRYEDDRGESFSTPEEAGQHAEVIAAELSRNNTKSVTVFVVAEDRFRVLQALERGNPYSARPGARLNLDEGLREQTRLSGIVARMRNKTE